MREAERAWFLSGGEESEALIRVAFDLMGKKQRVFEPYRLSILQWSLQLFPKTSGLNIATCYHRNGDATRISQPYPDQAAMERRPDLANMKNRWICEL